MALLTDIEIKGAISKGEIALERFKIGTIILWR